MRYTVLEYIIGDYESVHEVVEKDPEAEYILVTDNRGLKSSTWKVVVDEDLDGLSVWEKCYRIRFGCFKYCHADICVRIDASVGVLSSLKPIVDAFEEGAYDAALMIHPSHDNIPEEYETWVLGRGYPRQQAERCIADMRAKGYDFGYRGMFQLCFSIQRRGELTDRIDRECLAWLRELGPGNDIERLDQTVVSCLLNMRYSHLKVMPVSERLYRSSYFQWYRHGSDEPNVESYPFDGKEPKYMFDRPVQCREFPLPDAYARKREDWLLGEIYRLTTELRQCRIELFNARRPLPVRLAGAVIRSKSLRRKLKAFWEMSGRGWRT